MFKRIRQRLRDMNTLKTLCLEAEKQANADGQSEPGAEHFVLAALDLPDGTARKVFELLGADPDHFRLAIKQQYCEALQSIGVKATAVEGDADDNISLRPNSGFYQAQPSAQTLVQQLAHQRKSEPDLPLLGAHVIAAAASAQYGVANRAFQSMGVDPTRLASAASEVAAAF